MFQIGFPQPPVVADMGLRGNGAVPLSINLLMRFVLLSRRASSCGSSPALQQGSSHTGLGLRGFRLRLPLHLLAGFLGGFTMVCPPPCKLGGCGGVGFRLDFQFLVGVFLAVPLASRRSVSSGVSGWPATCAAASSLSVRGLGGCAAF